MTPFLYNEHAAYRMGQLKGQAASRRMATATSASAMHRGAHSLRGALGNGLIAIGSRLAVPPTADDFDFDKAA